MTSRDDVYDAFVADVCGDTDDDPLIVLDAYVDEQQAEAWDECVDRMERYHGRHPIDDHAPRPRNPYTEETADAPVYRNPNPEDRFGGDWEDVADD